MRTRIRLAITVAALTAGTALFIATPGAIATQAQPVLAGAQNTEDFETLIVNTNQVYLNDCLALNPAHHGGLVACGAYGVMGLGSSAGVYGKGASIGLYGSGNTGVQGSGTITGVFGEASDSAGKGVYGYANSAGTGVYGRSSTGDGVLGQTSDRPESASTA
jgi:hypothetical protein